VIDPVTLIVLILATARLTRLVAWDKITLPVRKAIISGITIKKKQIWKGSGVGGKLSYLVHCVFCVAFWASFIVIPNVIWPSNKWLFACYLILAVAEVAPRLLNWEPRTTGGE
jgi:uncharacterized protein DUF1360